MKSFFRGTHLALPIILGYLPVGFAFGVLAVQAGMSAVAVIMMSLFVFAGSAQLIAADLIGGGTGTAGVILTTFIVNLRHLLMSAALTAYLKNWSKPLQALFAFELTDETFAANLGRFYIKGVNTGETFGLNAASHFGWVIGSALGVFFDSAIGDVKPFGLDFALPAMFIALLVPHFAVSRRILAILFGASLSLVFAILGAGQWNVVLATAAAATLAAFLPVAPTRN